MIRKFLVKRFVLFYTYKSRLLRVFAEALPIPVAIVCLILGSFKEAAISGILGLLAYFLPIGNKIDVRVGRPAKIIYWTLLIAGSISIQLPNSILSWILWIIFALTIWVGFSGYKVGYFDLFPVDKSELDPEQFSDWENLEKINNNP